MSTLNNNGINLSISTLRHRISAIGVDVADVQLPSVQHRHVVLVVVAAAATMRPPPPPATPGRDGAGGSAEEEKSR